MKIEYLDKIGYIRGGLQGGFLIDMTGCGIDSIKKSGKKIVLLGVGENAFFAETLLLRRGVAVYGYADNSAKLQGKFLRGKEIGNPYDLFEREDVYFIITTQIQHTSDVRLQFMAHHICDYGIFLNTNFHDFMDEDPELHRQLMEAVNEICFREETTETVLPYGEWRNGNPGDCNWMLKSTRWSHWAYLWEREILRQSDKDVLEIGPGYGLMSLVLLKEFPDVRLDWIILGEENSQFVSGLKKIKKWYGAQIHEIWGEVERDRFHMPEKRYDLIIMTEVFEHFVLKPLKVLGKIGRALQDNGVLILTTPDWGHVHIYRQWEDMPEDADVDDARYERLLQCGHVYQYRKEELEDIFTRCGLTVVKYMRSDSGNHNYMLKKRIERDLARGE